MTTGKVAAIDGYDLRITSELSAYAEVDEVHDLPAAHDLWANRFILPLLTEIGIASIDDLWYQQIRAQCERCAPRDARLVSLGAGNGELELPLAARLASDGIANLELVLLELNPEMGERALERASELGLGDRARVELVDLNHWTHSVSADVYLANHSLHHLVELERLYDQVVASLDPEGVLLVNDMVGRNGHVRWPETGQIVREIWSVLPERYRFNRGLGAVDEVYPDLDCSTESFEGIRAQDVLPLLLERMHPEVYVTFGSVIDPFVDRVYGPNFDVDNPADVEIIDAIARLDDAALDLGIVTPTHLVGTFRPQPVTCRYPRHRSPERTVHHRDPVGPDDDDDADALAELRTELELARGRHEALRRRKAVRAALRAAEMRNRIGRAVRRSQSPQSAPADNGHASGDTGRAPADTGHAPAETGHAPADTGRAPAQTRQVADAAPESPEVNLLCWPLDHFYSPVANSRALAHEPARSRVWPQTPPPTPGIDWRAEDQVAFVRDLLGTQSEIVFPDRPTGDPHDYHTGNDMFSHLDAWMLQAVLRHFRPRKMVEVGCGWSSLVTARVNREYLGGSLHFTCIEPYPPDFLAAGVEGISELIVSPVESLDLDAFTALGDGDVLFIDTSHTTKTGGDVTFLYQEVLPRLRPGVVVHIHDIFLPWDYPQEWVFSGRAWNEQYLVRAFLSFNSAFEIVVAVGWLSHYHRDVLAASIPNYATRYGGGGGSLWIRRV